MASIHPVFKQRCEIDGVDAEECVLTGDDLEPDTGGPLDIEQPKEIATKPLSPNNQDDRIRMVFGLTSNDVLPDAVWHSEFWKAGKWNLSGGGPKQLSVEANHSWWKTPDASLMPESRGDFWGDFPKTHNSQTRCL